MKEKLDYKDRKYNIVDYDIGWQDIFNKEAIIIKNIFIEDVQIEHVGSTSVLGMAGKPCVDILVIFKNPENVKNHIFDMENAGYVYRGNFIRNDAFLFTKIENGEIKVNAHFFPNGHLHIKEMLELRDYLRNNADEVLKYSELKKELYKKYPNDYASYRKEKDEYMDELKKRINKF